MPAYNLRRFAHPDGLKAISPKHLLALLHPHSSYFEGRGLALPSVSEAEGLNYENLIEILMSPGTDTPKDLLDALFFVHEMAGPEFMDILLREAESNGISLADNPDPTVADVAVQIYLHDKNILERKHAEQYFVNARSYEYFQTERRPIPNFNLPFAEDIVALESDLDDWYESKKRGRGSRVFIYPKADAIWFLVRHGDPYKREGSLDGSQSTSVFYRPEKFDILVYDSGLGEIRMHACGKSEKETLLHQFGHHLFKNDDFFPGIGKYTLEPLRINGETSLVCSDVEGMEWVKLKELQSYWGGVEKEIEIHKANDLFAGFAGRGKSLPGEARIIRASFLVKFADSRTPRTVTIRPSNIAHYSRDNDAPIIEDWLTKRGFIISEPEDDEE